MKNSGFQVRPAGGADADAARALVFPVMEEFGLGIDPGGADADLFDIEAHYDRRGGWFELLYAGPELIGTVGMMPVGEGVIELRKMYLRRDWRGGGLGAALLARSVERARAAGWREIVLDTATVLEAAIALYRRYGFVRDTAVAPACGKSACDQRWHLRLADYRPPDRPPRKLEEFADD